MNKVMNKDIIELLCTFMIRTDIDNYRRCNKYLRKATGSVYFRNTKVRINKITKNYYKFERFIAIYKPNIRVIGVKKTSELNLLSKLKCIRTIEFKDTFNEEIKKLPSSLHTLMTSSEFDKPIEQNILPQSLHTLIFDVRHNQEIEENVLPGNLHSLKFSSYFNQPIKKHVLPSSLHTLVFGVDFNQKLEPGILRKEPGKPRTLVRG
jgi:predicted transcriptional regulator